jgi:aspartyl-tRNA(Asn)/glutamyl-tRNA(Gln) amidotransferase subunit A
MDALDLCFTPATELASLIRSKQLAPSEVVDTVLKHVEECEPQLNACTVVVADAAREQAQAADAAVAAGAQLGPLHGVPVTIKDLFNVKGLPTESGSFTRAGQIADASAVFVERLVSAGAIIIAKTTTSEFGWKGVSQSPLSGITSNPWRHDWNAGASSAGAGAGAAAGYGPLHQGSDGAGSIRMPAHFCGVYGLKPSFGRIPNSPVRNNDQSSHSGPMTRTVADAALMLQVMSGPHARDHYSLESPPADYLRHLRDGVAGLKIAFSPDLGHARVDPEVATLVAQAANTFADLGATVEEISPAWGPLGPDLIRYFWAAHELELEPLLDQWEAKMDPGLVACIRSAEGTSAQQYIRRRGDKLAYIDAIHQTFESYDLMLTPAVSVAAFPAHQLQPDHWPQHPWDWLSWAEFSYPFNFSHNPAASIPCGFTAAGLPVGLQIVGPRMHDAQVLSASAAFEQAQPWAHKRPQV